DKPGPAEYDVSTKWFKIDPRAKSVEPKPFISGAERLKSKKEDGIPAPCQYNVTSDVYNKKHFSTICAPFAVKDNRWHSKHTDNAPGPGHYEIKGFVDQNMDKIFNKYSLVEVGFGTLAERDTLNIGDAICLPGPGYYDIKKESFEEAKCTASVFKSKSTRLKEDCS
ncbi:sperm-tail PG-rich repeat-containing protein 2-like, partial [Agrilus planipennis]|uniref:Sperm-tail PG-rich repeat-containing protein 2-like n=1 Tax=Agrilus planipennis TaxID=224129 RepID=A0A1W4XFZ4_AGRPL